MTRTGFVIANLWRKKTRTVLTLLSIVTAFLLFGLLQVLNRDHGKTIVMVTHDPKAAEFANRILHLEKGQLLEQATAAA